MRLTVSIEDALYRQAVELADPGMGKADLMREALRTFVRIRSARRLALLGGGVPRSAHVTRRRTGRPALPKEPDR